MMEWMEPELERCLLFAGRVRAPARYRGTWVRGTREKVYRRS